MEQRLLKRFHTEFSVGFLGDLLDGKGQLLDLSTGGCRVQGGGPIKTSLYLHLFLHPPRAHNPVKVELAAVRWTSGTEFGVEFIRVSPDQQQRLQELLKVIELRPGSAQTQASEGWTAQRQGAAASGPEPSRMQDILDTLYDRWG